MVLVAFPAVYRSVAGWLEGYFSFLLAVSTGCFVHLSWTHVHISRTRGSKAATAGTAIIFVIHVYISFNLILLSKGSNCKFLHDPLDLYRYMVPDFCARHKNHKALYTCYTISLSGNALNCDIVDSAG